ncbi:hypothetical protein CDAR_606091 [Caerostris darwini]|uniref:Uncharacterized protein n=1 Tax=Caerostris darwini TaxID=1538125 RepID=A0AAV4RDI9_9ARAC|nr:hypothetical protein CDAR_606091 [Caerostris darwini]
MLRHSFLGIPCMRNSQGTPWVVQLAYWSWYPSTKISLTIHSRSTDSVAASNAINEMPLRAMSKHFFIVFVQKPDRRLLAQPCCFQINLAGFSESKIASGLLASPTFPEKQCNLSDEEHCARITTVIKKKDIAQNLYDAYAAALTGYSIDDDDLKQLKKRHDDLQLAMRENPFHDQRRK